jgi:hypothetical protein
LCLVDKYSTTWTMPSAFLLYIIFNTDLVLLPRASLRPRSPTSAFCTDRNTSMHHHAWLVFFETDWLFLETDRLSSNHNPV